MKKLIMAFWIFVGALASGPPMVNNRALKH